MEEKTAQEYAEEALKIFKLINPEDQDKELEEKLHDITRLPSDAKSYNGYSIEDLKFHLILCKWYLKIGLCIYQIWPDLSNILSQIPLYTTEGWEELRSLIRPLSYEELYYALDFLDEDQTFFLLSTLPNNEKTQLLNAYQQQNKQKFVDIASNIQSDAPCYAIFAILWSLPFIKTTIQKIIGERIYNQIEPIHKLSLCIFNPEATDFLKQFEEYENIDNEIKSCEKSINNNRNVILKSGKQQNSNQCIAFDESLNKITLLKEKRLFLRNQFLKFYEMWNILLKTVTYIQFDDTDTPTYLRKQCHEYLEPYNFIFENVKMIDINSINKSDFYALLRCTCEITISIIHKHKKNIEERIQKPQILLSQDATIGTSNKENEVKNLKKVNLGISPHISTAIKKFRGDNMNNHDFFYHKCLEYLYNYLTCNSDVPKIGTPPQPSISCTKEDFLYILGDKNVTRQETSDSPVINWIGRQKNEMQAFFYRLYSELDNTDKNIGKDTKIGKGDSKCCYSFQNRAVTLSYNKPKKENLYKYYDELICSIVKAIEITEDQY